MFDEGCGKEGGEGNQDVDYGKGNCTGFKAIEDAVFAGERGKDEELNEHAEDAIQGEHDADPARIYIGNLVRYC